MYIGAAWQRIENVPSSINKSFANLKQSSHLQNCVYEWDFLSPCQARGRLWG